MAWFDIFRAKRSRPSAIASAEDWQTGDQAECIFTGPWYRGGITPAPLGWGPQFGEVRVVAGTQLASPAPGTIPEEVHLKFDRYGDRSFSAHAFRKVKPRADQAERADAAFIGTMERIRQPARISARTVFVRLVLPPLAGSIFLYSAALTVWAVTAPGQAMV